MPTGPEAASHKAMARTEAAGGKLTPEEKAKREELGLDSYDRMKTHADQGVFPKGPDILRWKYHGLFYVAPAQDSFMCRMRMPNGILTHWQMRGWGDRGAPWRRLLRHHNPGQSPDPRYSRHRRRYSPGKAG